MGSCAGAGTLGNGALRSTSWSCINQRRRERATGSVLVLLAVSLLPQHRAQGDGLQPLEVAQPPNIQTDCWNPYRVFWLVLSSMSSACMGARGSSIMICLLACVTPA
eukprot:6458075-Amphidinium_carterae.1